MQSIYQSDNYKIRLFLNWGTITLNLKNSSSILKIQFGHVCVKAIVEANFYTDVKWLCTITVTNANQPLCVAAVLTW